MNDFYQTNIPGYYAIGDVASGQALAYVASAEGNTCVEKLAGLHIDLSIKEMFLVVRIQLRKLPLLA